VEISRLNGSWNGCLASSDGEECGELRSDAAVCISTLSTSRMVA
jgi:hypothetical protein